MNPSASERRCGYLHHTPASAKDVAKHQRNEEMDSNMCKTSLLGGWVGY